MMPSIISQTQSAFVKGRQILDPILIANEVVKFYRNNKKEGWILKLDIERHLIALIGAFLKKF